nr:SCP extracellular domain containing protein [Haemonchus contortus]
MLTGPLLLFLLANLMHNALVSSFECSCSLNSVSGSSGTDESTQTSILFSTMHAGMKGGTPASGSTSSSMGEREETSTASGTMSSGMSEGSTASGSTSSSMGESEETSTASGTMSSGKSEGSPASGSTSSSMGESEKTSTESGTMSSGMSEGSTASGSTSSSMGESEETSTASGTMSSGMSEGSPASGITSSSMGESEETSTASGTMSSGMSEGSPASGSTSSSMGESEKTSTASGTMSSEMSKTSPTVESMSASSTEASTEATTTHTSTSTETATSSPTTESTSISTSTNNRICPHNHVMDDMTRNKSIIAHNYRRSRLAQGLVKNKNGKDLPKASNMLRLLYNCDLEISAITSATRCSAKSMSSLPSDIQENIYLMPKSDAQDPQDAIIVAIKHWWSQIRITGGIGQGVTYTTYNEGKPTEWFTRMAWATTQYFGCAVISCADSNWSAVCHYKPGGNILNEHLYEKGTPCSACPSGDTCDSEYLCVPPGTTL